MPACASLVFEASLVLYPQHLALLSGDPQHFDDMRSGDWIHDPSCKMQDSPPRVSPSARRAVPPSNHHFRSPSVVPK
jgi:hypothetical protein